MTKARLGSRRKTQDGPHPLVTIASRRVLGRIHHLRPSSATTELETRNNRLRDASFPIKENVMPTLKDSTNAAIERQGIARAGTPDAPLNADMAGRHEISELAYQLWVERGCPIGSPDEDWFKAEEELLHTSHS